MKATDIALKEIGYLEKSKAAVANDPTVLDYKTKGAGSDNMTKYARDMYAVTNVNWQGQAWCLTFINWLFWQAYGYELANKLLCGTLKSASTMAVKDVFKDNHQLVALSDAQEGDIVFRSRKGGGHVGYVIGRATTGAIITIEGNTSSTDITSWNGGAVCKHVGASWEWCARPNYALIPRYEPQTWHSDDKGWWYAKTETEYAKNEWLDINHHRYYFDENGYAVTGYRMIGKGRYYFETSGDLMCALMITNEADQLTYKYIV